MNYAQQRNAAGRVYEHTQRAARHQAPGTLRDTLILAGAPRTIVQAATDTAEALERAAASTKLVRDWYASTVTLAYIVAAGFEARGCDELAFDAIALVTRPPMRTVDNMRLFMLNADALLAQPLNDDINPSTLNSNQEAVREARAAIAAWLQANPNED